MENCKDCPYVEALDKRLVCIEKRMEMINNEVNIATLENEKTKLYYDKMLSNIAQLKDIVIEKFTNMETLFTEKYNNLEQRVVKIELVIGEDKTMNNNKKLLDRKELWGIVALTIGIILPYILKVITD